MQYYEDGNFVIAKQQCSSRKIFRQMARRKPDSESSDEEVTSKDDVMSYLGPRPRKQGRSCETLFYCIICDFFTVLVVVSMNNNQIFIMLETIWHDVL